MSGRTWGLSDGFRWGAMAGKYENYEVWGCARSKYSEHSFREHCFGTRLSYFLRSQGLIVMMSVSVHYDWSAGHFWKVSHWPTRPGHNRNVIVCMSMQQILIAISLVFNSCSSSRSNSFKSDAGNPNPDDAIDYDRELITVGWVDILLGFAGADSFFKVGTNQDLTVEQQNLRRRHPGPSLSWKCHCIS